MLSSFRDYIKYSKISQNLSSTLFGDPVNGPDSPMPEPASETRSLLTATKLAQHDDDAKESSDDEKNSPFGHRSRSSSISSNSSTISYNASHIGTDINDVIDAREGDCKILYIPKGYPQGPFNSGKERIYVITKAPLDLFYIKEKTGEKVAIPLPIDDSFLKLLEAPTHLGTKLAEHPEVKREYVIVLDEYADAILEAENDAKESEESKDSQPEVLFTKQQFNNVLNLIRTCELKNIHMDQTLGNLYYGMQISTGKIRLAILEKLGEILDPVVFKREFTDSNKDENGRFILNKEDTVPNDYKKVLNIMHNIERFFGKSVPLHQFVMENENYVSIISGSLGALNDFFAWLGAYRDLYFSIEALQLFPFISTVKNFADFKEKVIAKLPFSTSFMRQEGLDNPFYHSFSTKLPSWKAMLDNSTSRLSSLKVLLMRENQDLRQEAIEATLGHISDILLRIEHFSASAQNPRDLFYFIYKIYPKLTKLLKTFPQSCESLKNVLNEHILYTAEQLNLMMREVYLQLDVAEMQLSLKENFLTSTAIYGTSVDVVAQGFTQWLGTLGYAFTAETRHPYFAARQTQKENLRDVAKARELEEKRLKELPAKDNAALLAIIPKVENVVGNPRELKAIEFVSSSISAANNIIGAAEQKILPTLPVNTIKIESDLAARGAVSLAVANTADQKAGAEEQKNIQNKLAAVRLTKINGLIDTRIQTLQDEIRDNYLFTSTKATKIRALRHLRTTLAESRSLTSALDQMHSDNSARPLLAYLSDGRTGADLKKMQLIASTKEDRANLINLEIAQLEKDRNKKLYFFAGRRKAALEKHIRALKFLKTLLNRSGYLLEDAKKELSTHFRDDYNILISKDKKLLKNITQIDHELSNKTTEILFSNIDSVRKNYPKFLRNVAKIKEFELLDGTNYREIHHKNTIERMNDFKNNPSRFAIDSNKDIQLKITHEADGTKTTALILNSNEEARENYPEHLKNVTEIKEVESADGTNYREIYRGDVGQIIFNFKNKLNIFAIENVKDIRLTTTIEASGIKTTEFILDTSEEARRNQPSYLKNVTKIREIELPDGKNYREIHREPMEREDNFKAQQSPLDIENISARGTTLTVNYEAGPAIGKQIVTQKSAPAHLISTREDESFAAKNAEIIRTINERITELDGFVNDKFFFTGTLKKQIAMARVLVAKLDKYSFQDAMNILCYDPVHAANYPLLWQGTLGESLKYIEDTKASHTDLVGQITTRILQLKQLRNVRPGWFSKQEPALEERIRILQKVENILKDPTVKISAVQAALTEDEHAIAGSYESILQEQIEYWYFTNNRPAEISLSDIRAPIGSI